MSAWQTVTQLPPRVLSLIPGSLISSISFLSASLFSRKSFSRTSEGSTHLILATLLALLTHSPSIASEQTRGSGQCPDGFETVSRKAVVRKVVDGDSVVLDTGERVRIIGINAPEIYPQKKKRQIKREQRFASSAKARVSELLNASSHFDDENNSNKNRKKRQVNLVAGPEPTDQHGRSLYHLILPSGKNIAMELIREGLAVQSAVSPNTRCAEKFAQIEKTARSAGRGLWNKPGFWLTDRRKLPRSAKGFHIVRDIVTKHSTISTANGPAQLLSLKKGARVFVSAGNLAEFKQAYPNKLNGKLIEIRGWFYHYRRGLTVNLHHPANLQVIPE